MSKIAMCHMEDNIYKITKFLLKRKVLCEHAYWEKRPMLSKIKYEFHKKKKKKERMGFVTSSIWQTLHLSRSLQFILIGKEPLGSFCNPSNNDLFEEGLNRPLEFVKSFQKNKIIIIH